MSGNALLSDKLAAARLETQPMNVVFECGLGIIKMFNEYGHEGEAIGWEGWAGHDPDTGLSVVVFTNSCSDLFGIWRPRSRWTRCSSAPTWLLREASREQAWTHRPRLSPRSRTAR